MIMDFLERFVEAISTPEILMSMEDKMIIFVGILIFAVIAVLLVIGFYKIKSKIKSIIRKIKSKKNMEETNND